MRKPIYKAEHYTDLKDMLKKSDKPECDISYDFCDYVSGKFMKSEEYRNTRHSTYEMLEQWIRDNKNLIQYEYNDFIGKEYETYNDKTVLLTGMRKDQPIVLVERVVDEKPEYIIGINYEIKDNNLSWGYGYYYDDDIKKALNDYQKVIEGGNLADTFIKKEELKVKFVGIDSWDRPVYKDKEGNIYKDVNLGRGEIDLHTAVNNDFYGEPDSPISDDIKVSVIKSFNKNNKFNMDDLFQVGVIGLIKAIDNFDTSLNLKLSTYAVPLIIGEVKRYIRDNTAVRVSRSVKDLAYKIIKYQDDYIATYGISPTNEMIAKNFNIAEYEISYAIDSLKDPMSIYEPIYNDGGDTIYLSDQIKDDKDYNTDRDMLISMHKALLKIKEKEKDVLVDRFIVGKTQTEIADELGISQAQVSRIEKSAINNVRRLIK